MGAFKRDDNIQSSCSEIKVSTARHSNKYGVFDN